MGWGRDPAALLEGAQQAHSPPCPGCGRGGGFGHPRAQPVGEPGRGSDAPSRHVLGSGRRLPPSSGAGGAPRARRASGPSRQTPSAPPAARARISPAMGGPGRPPEPLGCSPRCPWSPPHPPRCLVGRRGLGEPRGLLGALRAPAAPGLTFRPWAPPGGRACALRCPLCGGSRGCWEDGGRASCGVAAWRARGQGPPKAVGAAEHALRRSRG